MHKKTTDIQIIQNHAARSDLVGAIIEYLAYLKIHQQISVLMLLIPMEFTKISEF